MFFGVSAIDGILASRPVNYRSRFLNSHKLAQQNCASYMGLFFFFCSKVHWSTNEMIDCARSDNYSK